MGWRLPWLGGSIQSVLDNFKNGYQFGDFIRGWMGFYDENDDNSHPSVVPGLETTGDVAIDLDSINEVLSNSREEYLDDREHTEMREDTAYQRGVEDMKKAGLNPYTIGANPSPSSASQVGQNLISNKVQLLGYVLDLKNLDLKNKQLVNSAITSIVRTLI